MESRRFKAMGTDIELLVEGDGAGEALAAAESEFHRLEAILTRFRPESELSRLNEARSLEAGPDLLEVVRLALEARGRTDGRFDPTVHDAVVGRRLRPHVRRTARGRARPSPSAAVCGGSVRIDGSRIELDPGVRLDLGGIGKGYAAERAAELLSAAGPALVNAGGDIAVHGGSLARRRRDVRGRADARADRRRARHLGP